MKPQELLDLLGTPGHCFADTLSFIDSYYLYQPSGFDNGPVRNNAGENQGSCKVLAMALDLGLNDLQSVLASPDGHDHANIRALCDHGLAAVTFDSSPLIRR